jgi:hypothetical protein
MVSHYTTFFEGPGGSHWRDKAHAEIPSVDFSLPIGGLANTMPLALPTYAPEPSRHYPAWAIHGEPHPAE